MKVLPMDLQTAQTIISIVFLSILSVASAFLVLILHKVYRSSANIEKITKAIANPGAVLTAILSGIKVFRNFRKE